MTEKLMERIKHYLILYRMKECTEEQTASKILQACKEGLMKRRFNITDNNKGLHCPFKKITCQEGYCQECQIYLDRVRVAVTRAPLVATELEILLEGRKWRVCGSITTKRSSTQSINLKV